MSEDPPQPTYAVDIFKKLRYSKIVGASFIIAIILSGYGSSVLNTDLSLLPLAVLLFCTILILIGIIMDELTLIRYHLGNLRNEIQKLRDIMRDDSTNIGNN